jgi:hypothetical protein
MQLSYRQSAVGTALDRRYFDVLDRAAPDMFRLHVSRGFGGVDTFKLSTDPRFEEKMVDVVGLYLDPPERAVVLCVDEKVRHEAP